MLQITQPSPYRYAQLQYRFAVISEAFSILAAYVVFGYIINANNCRFGAVQTKNLTNDQRNEIIRECVEDQISPTELGKKHNISADTIRTWIRKSGKQLPKTYRRGEPVARGGPAVVTSVGG